MLRLDGTGPAGMGPMTGGARGWCDPYYPLHVGYGPYRAAYRPLPRPYYANYARPLGLGRPRWSMSRGFWGRGWGGRGRGRGRGRQW